MNKMSRKWYSSLISRARLYMHDAYFGIFCAHYRHFIEKLHYQNAIKDVRAYLSKTCYYKMHIMDFFVHINPGSIY